MTDEELLVEKKKLKKSKIIHATMIGFLAGILIFGIIAWSLSPEIKLGFIIPMLFPIFFIYQLVKNSKKNKDFEDFLKGHDLKK